MPRSPRDLLRLLRRAPRILLGQDFLQRRQVAVPTEDYGSDYGGWTLCPDGLTSDSVVYSFGVGEDISFDLGLIDRFGVRVHAFDPTPRSRAWIERQVLPERFTFHDIGVAAFEGTATFHAPADPAHVSFSMVSLPGTGSVVEAPVYRLATLLDRLRHDHVDLLKMDIEGAEYEVLDDLVASGLDVRQILVEFHHRFERSGVRRTKAAIQRLNEHGYRIFHVSPRGEEFSFIRC